jgi:hypothetical protein
MKLANAAPLLLPLSALLIHGLAVGQQPMASSSLGMVVYPSNSQTPSQQVLDENECLQWSKSTTGVDPANPMAGIDRQSPAPAPSEGAAAGGGALRGAAAGALIGNLADEDAGEYALAGAAIGSVRGARAAGRAGSQAQSQAAAEDEAIAAERVQLFKNAFGACMEGRKYTVR